MKDITQHKDNEDYIIFTALWNLVGLPILVQILQFIMIARPFSIALFNDNNLPIVFLLSAFIPAFLSGLVWARKSPLPAAFLPRYLPVLVPVLYYLVLWIGLMIISDGDFSQEAFNLLLFLYLPFLCINFLILFSGDLWLLIIIPLLCHFGFAAGLLLNVRWRSKPLVDKRGRNITSGLCLAFLVVCAYQGYQRERFIIKTDSEQSVAESISLSDWAPFQGNTRMTMLSSAATLSIDNNWPRLDGATAVYPVYASAAQALYQGLDADSVSPFVMQSRTPGAWRNLIAGKADLIFVAQPSTQQRQQALENHLALRMIPVAKEAFVFITHKDNPVTDLSVEQLRAIYAGEIDNWREAGGPPRQIISYQRPEGSGSQTIMLDKVMKGKKMRPPLENELSGGMGGITRRVADYQNSAGALGYTFRYYASEMDRHGQLRFLSVNGIAPTPENIRNGSYPFTVDVYMVTARAPSANTQKLIDWFLGPQGQRLVRDTGYIPVGTVE